MTELTKLSKSRILTRITCTFLLLITFCFTAKSQSLTSVSPNKGQLGEILNVAISGQGVNFNTGSSTIQTNFKQGTTTIPTTWVSVDPGGTVLNVSLDLTNTTHPTGLYDVEVNSNLHGIMTLTNGFEIDSVALRSASPNTGFVGQSFNVLLVGQSIDFTSVTVPPIYIGGSDTIQTAIVGTRGSDTLEISVNLTSSHVVGNYLLALAIPGDTLLLRNALEVKTVSISGTVFYDINANGAKDSIENGMANVRVRLLPDNIFALTNLDGNYSFDHLAFGNYQVVVIPPANTFTTNPSVTQTVNVNALKGFNASFGINSTNIANFYNTTFSLMGIRGRCSSAGSIELIVRNDGFLPSDGIYKVVKDSASNAFQNRTIVQADSIDGDTAFFSYTNFNPGGYYRQVIYFSFPSVTVLPINSKVQGSVLSWQRDSLGAQIPGTFVHDSTRNSIRCSYDPNDIAVSPVGVGPKGLLLHNTELQYHIRFQNTGNDTAYRVVILDTLSNNLDLSTFEFVGSSHAVNTLLKPNGELSFTFNNIFLVDSIANEPESHGFVNYNISPKAGLLDSTVVTNRAGIYFDFNPPVITNTVSNMYVTIITSLQDYEFGLKANVYPNPSTGLIRVQFEEKINNASIRICDIQGKVVHQENGLNGIQLDLNLEKHPRGVYFIQVVDGKNYLKKKVILH